MELSLLQFKWQPWRPGQLVYHHGYHTPLQQHGRVVIPLSRIRSSAPPWQPGMLRCMTELSSLVSVPFCLWCYTPIRQDSFYDQRVGAPASPCPWNIQASSPCLAVLCILAGPEGGFDWPVCCCQQGLAGVGQALLHQAPATQPRKQVGTLL